MRPQLPDQLIAVQKNIPDSSLLVIADAANITYLTGLPHLVPAEREALLFLTRESLLLCTTAFTTLEEIPEGIEQLIGLQTEQIANHVQSLCTSNITRLILDIKALRADEFLAITESSKLPYTPFDSNWISRIRVLKQPSELVAVTQACQVTQEVMSKVQTELEPGVSELEVKQKIKLEFLKRGAEGEAFPTIVAFGDHTALPHHQPTDRKLTKETPVLIDIGAAWDGYCGDMTRSLWFGDKPSPKFTQIQEAVLTAYKTATAVLDGANWQYQEITSDKSTKLTESTSKGDPLQIKELDLAARNYLKELDFDKYFIHTLGHGLGLEIHEYPSINWKNSDLLVPNSVITIEPGVYIPELFGYRHENTLIVR